MHVYLLWVFKLNRRNLDSELNNSIYNLEYKLMFLIIYLECAFNLAATIYIINKRESMISCKVRVNIVKVTHQNNECICELL